MKTDVRRTKDEGRRTRDEGRGTRDRIVCRPSERSERSSIIRRLILVTGIWLLVTLMVVATCYALPDRAIFISKLVWRADGEGDYAFKENGKMDGTAIAGDGSVAHVKSPGTYELTTPYVTEGKICGITANWSFTGEVTMEVSATGNAADYVKVVNGVPLESEEFTPGAGIKWRATLAPGSSLTEVNIGYIDLSGVLASFGNPALSGFMFRKPVYIKLGTAPYFPKDDVSENRALSLIFHYQVPIKVGESSKSENCDVSLEGVIQADFADVRFTQADKDTLLPYWLEGVTGKKPNRTATFWINIPQIPEEGVLIFLYYGNKDAEGLSDGEEVFDFFDDFEKGTLDTGKWTEFLDDKASILMISNSNLRLDGAKITSNIYEMTNGIIEYKASAKGAAVASVIRGNVEGEKDRIACSSAHAGGEHCMALGDNIKINTDNPISNNTYYTYRIIANGENLTFQRYDADCNELEAEVEYADTGGLATGFIGLFGGTKGAGAHYDWIRVRKLVLSPPVIDKSKTEKAQEEIPNIAGFEGLKVAPNGDLLLKDEDTKGEYVSQLIHSPFKARIIVPSWTMESAEGSGDSLREGKISIDISAKEYGAYREDCENKAYYYSSKKDFTEGESLRWRARFSGKKTFKVRGSGDRGEWMSDSPRLKKFTLDFRPAKITLIAPNGKEILGVGSECTVKWDAANYGTDYKMKLEYSVDGGKTFKIIANEAKNSGRYLWTVPTLDGDRSLPDTTPDNETCPLSDRCVIKASDTLDEEIYDVSDDYFSIVTSLQGAPSTSLRVNSGDEAISEEEEEEVPEEEVEEATAEVEEEEEPEEEEETPQRPGTSLYEMLIKVGTTRSRDPEGRYEDGDIVMIKPAGFIWGGVASNPKFKIIQAYLTPQEAEDLTKPKESEDGTMLKRRRYRVTSAEKGLSWLKAKVASMKGLLKSRPLVDITAVKEK